MAQALLKRLSMHVGGVSNDLISQATGPGRPTPQPHEGAGSAATFSKALDKQTNKAFGVVQATRTQLSENEAKRALSAAWTKQFGAAPRAETVAVLTAQWSHETGNGHSMFNYNFGGIKGTGPSGLTVNQRTREGYGEHERTIRDNFRAYRNAEEGASDYLSLLARKYPAAIEAADAGKPEDFVRELKKGGYFTGSESAYISSVSRRTEQILERSSGLNSAAPAEHSIAPPPQAVAILAGTAPPSAPHVAGSAPYVTATAGSTTGEAMTERRPYAELPRAFDIQNFNDALSRAALSIALDPGGEESRHI